MRCRDPSGAADNLFSRIYSEPGQGSRARNRVSKSARWNKSR